MERSELIAARTRQHWTLKEASERIGIDLNTLYRWERGKKTPHAYNAQRICEVYGMTAEELGLYQSVMKTETNTISCEEFLPVCHANIAACGELAEVNMQLASQGITTLLPILGMIIEESSRYRKAAASQASQICLMKQRLAYHLEGVRDAMSYAESAVAYAREANDRTYLSMGLRELASVYEWPLAHIEPHKRRKKALELAEEAEYWLDDSVSPLAKSWVYIGVAKFQAMNGLKQEALTSVGNTYENLALSSKDQAIPAFHIDQSDLARQKSHVHLYFNQQDQTLNNLLDLVDINDVRVPGKGNIAPRTRCGLLSEATIASLKMSPAKRDKALSIRLWRAELEAAQTLHSETYLSEA